MSGIDRDRIEREVKLEVDGRFEVPALEGASPLEPHRLDAVYHDTVDLRLLDQGITVRRRSGEGTRWTVKFPAGQHSPAAGEVARREVEIDSDEIEPPSTVNELVAPYLGGGALEPVARLVSVRERLALVGPDGSTLAEVDDDRVSARAMVAPDDRRTSGAEVSFREIEVEFGVDASPELIEVVVGRFREAGARASDGTPKVERALTLLGLR
ncbi:MAG: CYTH domain-containing protein [Acidimicrobiales bacterium]